MHNNQIKTEVYERILKTHIEKIHTVTEWAYFCDTTEKRLQRIFKKEKHKKPKNVIVETRIHVIKKIMRREPDVRLNEIACRTGFQSGLQLSKYVQYHRGMSPRQFRNRVRNS